MRIDAGLNVVADFAPIPEGVYEFLVKDSPEVNQTEGKVNDLGKPLYIFVIFAEVSEGEQVGKRVRRQLSNQSAGTRFFMKQFLTGIGVAVGDDGSFDTDDVQGRRFKALAKIREYDAKDGSRKKASEIDADTCQALA